MTSPPVSRAGDRVQAQKKLMELLSRQVRHLPSPSSTRGECDKRLAKKPPTPPSLSRPNFSIPRRRPARLPATKMHGSTISSNGYSSFLRERGSSTALGSLHPSLRIPPHDGTSPGVGARIPPARIPRARWRPAWRSRRHRDGVAPPQLWQLHAVVHASRQNRLVPETHAGEAAEATPSLHTRRCIRWHRSRNGAW
jgi:hypothetical protein